MPKLTLWALAGILLMLWLLGWMLRIAGQIIHGLAIVAVVLFAAGFLLRRGQSPSG